MPRIQIIQLKMDCGSEQGVQNEEIKMTKKYLEKYFSSVAVKEIQFKKITLKCHLIEVRMVKINKTTVSKCW